MSRNRDRAALESEFGFDRELTRSRPAAQHAREPEPISAADFSEGMSGAKHERLLSLLQGQTEVLHLISTGAPLKETLAHIAALSEHVIESAGCAIQMLDLEAKELTLATAPSLPPGFLQAPNQAGDTRMNSVGSLCLAAGKPLFVSDPEGGPNGNLENLLDFAASDGFKACWAHPVLGRQGNHLGVLSLYFRAPQSPEPGDKRILAALAALMRFAIEHDGWAAALRSADQRFASLATSIPGVVYQRMVTPDGQIRYTYISNGAKELFGVSPAEILADPNALFDCHGAQYRETFRERLLEASRELKMWDVEATIVTRDGRRKFTHAIARPHREPDGTVLWDGIILDATRIKEAELEAAATEVRTRQAILESISQGLALYDKEERLVVCNSHFRDLYPELANLIRPGVKYDTILRAMIDYGVDSSSGAAEFPDGHDGLTEPRPSRRHATEWRLRDGRWIQISENRTPDDGIAVVHTDITELKERAAALERSNRELQDFASVASHDLQEPLRKIEAFGDRLQRKYGGAMGEDAALYLNRIQASTVRMRALINDLLSYSRVTSKAQPFGPCDLAQVSAEVISDLQMQIEESGGTVEIGDLPIIDADATQMRQLLQNLISNALKFRQPTIAPLVKVSGRLTSIDARAPIPENAAGELCELQVSDNGIGFEMKHADRIFNIFQRLHGRSEFDGTGIGLATCRKIVERHGGQISAMSAPGQGATFKAILPRKQTANLISR